MVAKAVNFAYDKGHLKRSNERMFLGKPEQSLTGPWFSTAFAGILVLSLAANALLVRQNRQLQTKLASAEETPLGRTLIPITGVTLGGQELSMDLGKLGARSVLLVYSPACHFCKINWTNWAALLPRMTASGWTPIFADISGTTDATFVKQHGLEHFTVFRDLSSATKLAFVLRGTPTTVLFDRQGRAEKVWVGLLSHQDILDFGRLLQSPEKH